MAMIDPDEFPIPDWTGRIVPTVTDAWWRRGSLFVEFEPGCVVRYPEVSETVAAAFAHLRHDMQYFTDYIAGYHNGFMQTHTSAGRHYTEINGQH